MREERPTIGKTRRRRVSLSPVGQTEDEVVLANFLEKSFVGDIGILEKSEKAVGITEMKV